MSLPSLEDLLEKVRQDEFITAYLEAALWSSSSGEHENFDDFEFEDIHPKCLAQAIADCESFKAQAGDLILDEDNYAGSRPSQTMLEQAGHDFWLTRNHHGVGFWEDGDWADSVRDPLTKLAHSFREVNVTEEDGVLYIE